MPTTCKCSAYMWGDVVGTILAVDYTSTVILNVYCNDPEKCRQITTCNPVIVNVYCNHADDVCTCAHVGTCRTNPGRDRESVGK